jgi:phenylacetate-coenzyme A ligase PaaK-like adenylate-forming protein
MAVRNELRYGARFLVRDLFAERRIRTLLRHERLPEGELRAIADRLLLETLRAAVRRIPRYRYVKLDFDAATAREALSERFPIVDRSDLVANPTDHCPWDGVARPWTIIGRTSGTSGTPLQVFRSVESVLWEQAFLERQFRWSGYRPGMRRAYLRGDMPVAAEASSPPFWFYNRYNRQLIISSRHLRDDCGDAVIGALAQFAPYMLQAYPSTAYELARLLERRGRSLRIPYVFTASEPLYAHQRELIESRLGARVMDYYGMAERVAYAAECEHGNLHLSTDYAHVEIVDDDGRPTRGEGYLVGTTFHNDVMPLVRYRLSDRTRWRLGGCPCGRVYPMIEPVTGKYEDTLYGACDQPISPSIVTFAFKSLRGIERSQVAQIARGRWEIRIVPGAGFDAAQRRLLVENVRRLVDPGLQVVVREVADIPRTSAHKYRWIVNECKADGRVPDSWRNTRTSAIGR